MRAFPSAVAAFLSLGLVVGACSSSESSTSSTSTSTSTGGSGSTPATNCQSRCEAKGSQCGSPAADATTRCQSACQSATEADLKCIEDASCTALAKSDGKCPTRSSSSSSGSGSSSSSSGGPGCKIGCLSVADCGACAGSDDGTSSYPLCCDKGSTGNPKTCRNRKCCLNFGDECTQDSDCCANSAYKCKANGAKKTCST